MCSFLLTSLNPSPNLLHQANYFMKNRGPDGTNIVNFAGFVLLHNLLHITGRKTFQPIINRTLGLASLHNGEIYNFEDIGNSLNEVYGSDSSSVIGAYKLYGSHFATHLDGEFALVLLDSVRKKIVISTDAFGIKPIWVAIEKGEFGVASYASALLRLGFETPLEIPPNTAYVIDAEDFQIVETYSVHLFNLRQYKTHLNDWTRAFERSINKRIRRQPKFAVPLSSGHDSGAIACALASTNKNMSYHLVSISGIEISSIINQRFEFCQPGCKTHVLHMNQSELHALRLKLHKHTEDYSYIPFQGYCNINYKCPDETTSMLSNDNAAPGIALISSMIKHLGVNIIISGSGADETISDYAFNGTKLPFLHHMSSFAGKFPQDLKTIFSEWYEFYCGSQRNYLRKEDYVSGSYGLETRYPYLDKEVVQEYLWLTADLKNSLYKLPITSYLQQHNCPFQVKKVGFLPLTPKANSLRRLILINLSYKEIETNMGVYPGHQGLMEGVLVSSSVITFVTLYSFLVVLRSRIPKEKRQMIFVKVLNIFLKSNIIRNKE